MAEIVVIPPADATSLVEIIKTYPLPGWQSAFEPRLRELENVETKILEISPKYYPPPPDVFNCFYYTPLNKVRVVIIGQDPYYTGCAMGLAFSVRRGKPVPPSLDNIFEELSSDLGMKPPKHGDLSRWAVQEGVLLLNTCLTTKPGEDKAHGKLWLPLIKPALELLTKTRPKTLFLLWGKHAQGMKKFIGSCPVLETSHPSPLGAHHGFIGCKHFSKTNEYLTSIGEQPIDWRLD
jgi:uracil-DNA glycosylase